MIPTSNMLRTYQMNSASRAQSTRQMPDYDPGSYTGPDDTGPSPQRNPGGPDDSSDPDFGRGRYDDYYGGGGSDPDGSGYYNGI